AVGVSPADLASKLAASWCRARSRSSVNTPCASGVQPFTILRTLPKDSVVMIETQTREFGGSVSHVYFRRPYAGLCILSPCKSCLTWRLVSKRGSSKHSRFLGLWQFSSLSNAFWCPSGCSTSSAFWLRHGIPFLRQSEPRGLGFIRYGSFRFSLLS